VRSESLSLIDLDTLEQEIVAFNPISLQTATTSADPDKILLRGYIRGLNSLASYLYSIRDRTLSRLDESKLQADRLIYIPSLKKQAVISESKIAILDRLPLEQPVALDKLLGDAQQQANQKKLDLAMQMESAQAAAPAFGGWPQLAGRAAASGIMADLAKHAQIEAVGVYQGVNGRRAANRTGDIEVRIRRSAKPIFLVLSAYERVQWRLVLEQGAQLSGVLVSGYEQSQVSGAGSARVAAGGREYAYQRNTSQFAALNAAVLTQLGRPIEQFQGRYESDSFTVGGN
jgi:hypothetical protein